METSFIHFCIPEANRLPKQLQSTMSLNGGILLCALCFMKGVEADGVNVEKLYNSLPQSDNASQTDNGLLC